MKLLVPFVDITSDAWRENPAKVLLECAEEINSRKDQKCIGMLFKHEGDAYALGVKYIPSIKDKTLIAIYPFLQHKVPNLSVDELESKQIPVDAIRVNPVSKKDVADYFTASSEFRDYRDSKGKLFQFTKFGF